MQTRPTSHLTRRHALVVLATLVLVVLVTAVATLLARPPYASTAEALVGGQGQSAGDSSRARAASYAELANSRQLASAVDSSLGLKLSTADMQDRISAEVLPGTLLLRIRATDADPATAQKICAAVLDQLRTLVAGADPSARPGVDSIGTVSAASLPTDRAAGHLLRNLGLSVPFGIVLGLLLVAGLALRRRPVRSRADIEAVVDAPLLGTVPVNGQVAALIGPDAQGADDLRHLREGFRFLGIDADSSIVVLTSPHRGHDALECATHLAVSMAEAGESVLLVDGDLRLPEVADLLRLDRTVGLSGVLVGEQDFADAVQTHAASGLAVLASGPTPPNAAELTGSRAMRSTFARARKGYATVLIAAPSLADSDDAVRLAAAADGAVLVIRDGRLSREELRRATRRLDAVGAPILGVATTRLVGLRGPEVASVQAPAGTVGSSTLSPTTPPASAAAAAPLPTVTPVGATSATDPVAETPAAELTQPIQDLPLVSSETGSAHEWPIQAPEPTPEPFWMSTPAPQSPETADDAQSEPEHRPLAAEQPFVREVPPVEILEPWPGLEPVDQTRAASESAVPAVDEPEVSHAAEPVAEPASQFVFPAPTAEDESTDQPVDRARNQAPDQALGESPAPWQPGGPLFESVLVEPHPSRSDLSHEPVALPDHDTDADAHESVALPDTVADTHEPVELPETVSNADESVLLPVVETDGQVAPPVDDTVASAQPEPAPVSSWFAVDEAGHPQQTPSWAPEPVSADATDPLPEVWPTPDLPATTGESEPTPVEAAKLPAPANVTPTQDRPSADGEPVPDLTPATATATAQLPVYSDRFPAQPHASAADPLGTEFVLPAEDGPGTTPAFQETALGLDDTQTVLPAFVEDAATPQDEVEADVAQPDDLVEARQDEDDDEPRTGSLLDEFLTEDEDPEADLAPEPDDLERVHDSAPAGRATMWRPSRWIG